MNRFINNSTNRLISEYIQDATTLLLPNSIMLAEIKDKNDWKYGSGNGLNVAVKLMQAGNAVPVYVVPKTRDTSAVAYFQNGKTYLYADYVASASPSNVVGTLLHEYAHHQGFNHFSAFGTSNYKTKAKCLYSVPYYLSENAWRWL
jgi:hypothetical protein